MMDYMRECHWFRVAHNVDKQLLFIPRCGITKASCSTDKCPADFGEWGAWRACSRQVTKIVNVVDWICPGYESLIAREMIDELLDSAGWGSMWDYL